MSTKKKIPTFTPILAKKERKAIDLLEFRYIVSEPYKVYTPVWLTTESTYDWSVII